MFEIIQVEVIGCNLENYVRQILSFTNLNISLILIVRQEQNIFDDVVKRKKQIVLVF